MASMPSEHMLPTALVPATSGRSSAAPAISTASPEPRGSASMLPPPAAASYSIQLAARYLKPGASFLVAALDQSLPAARADLESQAQGGSEHLGAAAPQHRSSQAGNAARQLVACAQRTLPRQASGAAHNAAVAASARFASASSPHDGELLLPDRPPRS